MNRMDTFLNVDIFISCSLFITSLMIIYSKPDEDKENKKDAISPVAELHLEVDWSVNWSYNNYFHLS